MTRTRRKDDIVTIRVRRDEYESDKRHIKGTVQDVSVHGDVVRAEGIEFDSGGKHSLDVVTKGEFVYATTDFNSLGEPEEIHSPAIYRHYKTGDLYLMLAEAVREKDLEPVVVYASVTSMVWTRPRSEFFGEVEHEGKMVPRFALVRKLDSIIDQLSFGPFRGIPGTKS